MDLAPQAVRDALLKIEQGGWDSVAGRELLDGIRRSVVVPVVRRSGLRGPAADQAAASAWEAAWDALRRPTARTAENPGGMVWAAVRRAVRAEVEAGRAFGRGSTNRGGHVLRQDDPWSAGAPAVHSVPPDECEREDGRSGLPELSLDRLMDSGWQPTEPSRAADERGGQLVASLVAGLIEVGWEAHEVTDAIAIMADHAGPRGSGRVGTRWRWVALRLGVPEWRARRLAALLLGGPGGPGIVELAAEHGPQVVDDPVVRAALRSTTRRRSAGPTAWLAGWDPALGSGLGA